MTDPQQLEPSANPMVAQEDGLTTYERWQRSEGIRSYRGSYLRDLYGAELDPWTRFGQRGAFVNLADQEKDDGYLLEIAPGESTLPQRHMFEAMVFVVSGRGATSVWQPDGPKHTFEWGPGSLFSPPLNTWYQHFNVKGDEPARLFAVTSAPLMINIFHNERFVFGNHFVFDDRFDPQADSYFDGSGRQLRPRVWKTAFVPDVRSFELQSWDARGAGSTNVLLALSNNAMGAHISEFPVGTYKKAHRHDAGAHVVIVGGTGYSLLWYEGGPRERVDWKDGDVISPKAMEYHQHFNTGSSPARYLALRWNSPEYRMSGSWHRAHSETGGQQIESEDEAPQIFEEFAKACAESGVEARHPLSGRSE
jgi:quercetin dioxygenase-like cupin family protein